MIEPQWIAVALSGGALVFALKRDNRNARREDLESLRRERDNCEKRLSLIEGQLIIVREDNIVLMRKALRLPDEKST